MKKLPIGLQDFGELREGGFVYIDKTELLYHLVTEGKYYFLSRPRRFGKSLLISTLSELFRGNQTLFEGLWIHDRWDWNQTYPVIHLSMNSLGYKEVGLERALTLRLEKIAARYGLTLQSEANSLRLQELIELLDHSFGKVAVLIDEYDKPILDYLEDLSQATHHRELLKSFYSVLKDADPHLRFVLLTGVSKFSRVSIFSELNNLLDLTLHPRYATLLGYTQSELENYFPDRLDQLAPQFGGQEALLVRIRQWYNGYSWDAEHFVYNPFSILNFFDRGTFENFWFETGTPTFLIKLLNREQQYDLEHLQARPLVFSSFELERIQPLALLFQTGYVTIKAVDDNRIYTLSYPNYEVKDSLLQYLLAEYSHQYPSDTSLLAFQMKEALEHDDVAAFATALNALFASIPYQIFIADKEAYYHSVTFLALSLVGSFVQVEVSQARGRPDAVVHTKQAIYVLEFKLDESAETALVQIQEKGYAQPYLTLGKIIKIVGFSFSSQQKALTEWKEEKIS